MNIKRATEKDIDEIAQLYDDLNDYLAEHDNGPRWKKGVYPLREHAERAVAEGTLYEAVIDGRIAGAVVYSREQDEAYREIHWQIGFDVPVIVINKLAVHPDYMRCGVAKALLNYAVELGRTQGIKAIRLDTYEENVSAIKLYEKCCFQYMGRVDLGLEDTYGLKWYKVYEKIV